MEFWTIVKKEFGFTLAEILVVITILGIMAGLAMPTYFSTVEQARSNEARINLQIIRAGQKIYALNNINRDYWDPGVNPPVNGDLGVAINPTLNVDITTQYYNITLIDAINETNPKTFTAVATRNVTGGATISINQDGVFS